MPDALILHWPADAALRDDLAARGIPRLLVLDAGAVPPPAVDDREDWVWLPTDERDVFSRLRRLSGRSAPSPAAGLVVGDDGVLVVGGGAVVLPPAEAAILRELAATPGRLCPRDRLAEAAWGDVPHERRSLDSRVFVLRRRLAAHGVAIHAVRGRGFVLTLAGGPQ